VKVLHPSTETGRVLFKTIQGGSRAALERAKAAARALLTHTQSHTLLFRSRFRCAYGCSASYLRGV